MRGGKFQQKSSEDASTRNAEGLFESRTVSEIREVEARTRKDIEEKKEELRQLVGASYRDLIESADSILNMRRSCEAVVANIAAMEGGFGALHRSIATSVAAPGADESRRRREKLYGLGTRVKYLVDTPEKIWGCLDEHMYLEGAERYMRAREVHALLAEAGSGEHKDLLALFPLLRHQWPLVETFKNQISQRSRDRLQEPGLKVEQYAVALASVAVIDGLNSSQIFGLFLESRRTWVRVLLRAAAAGRPGGAATSAPGARPSTPPLAVDAPAVGASLCRLVAVIQLSLCHVGELFLEVSTGKMPLLFGTILEAAPGSQLFGGIPDPEREVELWREHRQRLEEAMTALPGKAVQEACQTWLRTVAEDIAVEGRLILEHIKHAKDLAEIEAQIRSSMAHHETFAESIPWLTAAFGARPDSPWDCIWELLLKEPVDLWTTLFETTFMDRAKAIVDSAFHALTITEQVEQFLAETEPPKVVDLGGLGALEGLEGSGGLAWKVGPDEKDWSSAKSAYFSPQVTQLRDEVDQKLHSILADVLHMGGGLGGGSGGRSKELAPYLQERCFSSLTSIIKGLEAQLRQLARRGEVEESLQPVTVERALLIGRLCAALGQYSACLPVILGAPSMWGHPGGGAPGTHGSTGTPGKPRLRGGWADNSDSTLAYDSSVRRLARRSGQDARGEEGAGKLREVQRELRRVSIAAHQVWVDWSTQQLGATFAKDLRKDETLATSVPLKGWEETVQKSVMEEGEVEMRIALPAMPSGHCLSMLYAGAREIHRVGSHTLDRAVLRLFAWRLSEQVLATYDSFTSDEDAMRRQVSEKGVLQLLFDIKFLADVLSGGSEISPDALQEDDPLSGGGSGGSPGAWGRVAAFGGSSKRRPLHAVDAGALGRKARLTGLIDALLQRLDPVDAAMYEEQLWENERRYYNRCAVLYGALVQLNRLHTDTPPRHAHAADTNTLAMAPPVPRFTHLPISAPLLSSHGAPPGSRTRKAGLENGSAWQTGANGDASKYSFTDIAALASVGSVEGPTPSPLFKSIMGQVGSGALKLGSIVSDGQVGRNISTLGEMLPSQAAGLFSSLTTGGS